MDRSAQVCVTTLRSANGRLLRPQGGQGIREPSDNRAAVALGLCLSTTRAHCSLQNGIRPGTAAFAARLRGPGESRRAGKAFPEARGSTFSGYASPVSFI